MENRRSNSIYLKPRGNFSNSLRARNRRKSTKTSRRSFANPRILDMKSQYNKTNQRMRPKQKMSSMRNTRIRRSFSKNRTMLADTEPTSEIRQKELEQYIPSTILRYLATGVLKDSKFTCPSNQRYQESAAIFIDVCGYTKTVDELEKLFEKHQKQKDGLNSRPILEQLVFHLNRLNQTFIKSVGEFNGDVTRFAGDAMEIVFPGPAADDEKAILKESLVKSTLLQAIKCAFAIRAKMYQFTNVDFAPDEVPNEHKAVFKRELEIKIGIGYGALSILHLGGADDNVLKSRNEYIALGAALEQAKQAERLAMRKGVILHGALLEPSCKICKCLYAVPGEDYCAIELIPTKEDKKRFIQIPLNWSPELESFAWRYVPIGAVPYIFQPSQLAAVNTRSSVNSARWSISSGVTDSHGIGKSDNGEQWLDEFRQVTTLFINLGMDGSNMTDSDGNQLGSNLANLQEVFLMIQEVVFSFEGTINKLLIDKTCAVMVVFGLPPFSHVDDPKRGVICALEIIGVLRKEKWSKANFIKNPSIGVTTGVVVAGVVGGSEETKKLTPGSYNRKEYGLLGDCVNVAARLMMKAREKLCFLFVDEATRNQVRNFVRFGPAETLPLKGKGDHKVFTLKSIVFSDDGRAHYEHLYEKNLRAMSKHGGLTSQKDLLLVEHAPQERRNSIVRIQLDKLFNNVTHRALDAVRVRQTTNRKKTIFHGNREPSPLDMLRPTPSESGCEKLYGLDMLQVNDFLDKLSSGDFPPVSRLTVIEGEYGVGKTYVLAQVTSQLRGHENRRVVVCSGNPYKVATRTHFFRVVENIIKELQPDLNESMIIEACTDISGFKKNSWMLNNFFGTKFSKETADFVPHDFVHIGESHLREASRIAEGKTVQTCTTLTLALVRLFGAILHHVVQLQTSDRAFLFIDNCQHMDLLSWRTIEGVLDKYPTDSADWILIHSTLFKRVDKFTFEAVPEETEAHDYGAKFGKSSSNKLKSRELSITAMLTKFSERRHTYFIEFVAKEKYTKHIIAECLDVEPETVSKQLTCFLEKKTRGMPLFISDALNLYRAYDPAILETSDAGSLAQGLFRSGITPAMESIFSEMMDRLSLHQQLYLKTASVLLNTRKNTFSHHEVLRCFPLRSPRSNITHELKFEESLLSLHSAGLVLLPFENAGVEPDLQKGDYICALRWDLMAQFLKDRMLRKQRERVVEIWKKRDTFA